MKTSLLFILALFIGFSVSAQKATKLTPVNRKAQAIEKSNWVEPAYTSNSTVLPAYVPKTTKGTNADVAKVYMGCSRNAFTLLVQEQNGMSYNKEVNAVMGNFRGNDKAVTGLPTGDGKYLTGNDVVTCWSTDNGTTQTKKAGIIGTTVLRSRYPSGVIFNPEGNTDLELAYSLVAGPVTNGGGWTNTYFASVQYNGNNLDMDYPVVSDFGELVRQGLTATTDGYGHICTMKQKNDGVNYTELKSNIFQGVFNTNTLGFDWTSQDFDMAPLLLSTNGFPEGNGNYANMAWSKDGSVGYLMHIGVDVRSGENKGYYPILFKSVDQGTSWQQLDYFDFSVFPDVFDNVWSITSDPNVAIPAFQEADMVVDGSGNLHIMALCKGMYSQDPDSLGYTYLYENGSIFEFSLEQDGQWFCHFIDHPKCREVSAENSPYVTAPPPNVGWDMRLQASRTDDGSKVFAVWTDTDWQFWSMADSINLYPDVMAWGRDVTTNGNTTVKNITNLQEGMGECHFMFVSPVCIDNSGVYDIPVRISDINTSSLNADEPVAHYYLQGTTFFEEDFVIMGGQEAPKSNKVAVANYPNPFNGSTKIDITLEKSAPVSLVVNSITGQQVSSVNYGVMSAGSQTLTFDGSKLTSGIYFYTVTIGDQKATNKMIVK
jgi:hypothetical protein